MGVPELEVTGLEAAKLQKGCELIDIGKVEGGYVSRSDNQGHRYDNLIKYVAKCTSRECHSEECPEECPLEKYRELVSFELYW